MQHCWVFFFTMFSLKAFIARMLPKATRKCFYIKASTQTHIKNEGKRSKKTISACFRLECSWLFIVSSKRCWKCKKHIKRANVWKISANRKQFATNYQCEKSRDLRREFDARREKLFVVSFFCLLLLFFFLLPLTDSLSHSVFLIS